MTIPQPTWQDIARGYRNVIEQIVVAFANTYGQESLENLVGMVEAIDRQTEQLATQVHHLAWCQAHRATIIFGIHGTDAVEVSIRTYPSVRAETLEQAVARLQEIQHERKQQGREETL